MGARIRFLISGRRSQATCLRRLMLAALVQLSAWSGTAAAGESLDAAIREYMNQPRFKPAHWGALFVDLQTGDVLFERDGDKLFVAASTTKLFSVACALDAFGADHRFQTPIVRRGEVNELGELAGDLILIAAGDFSLGGRTNPDGTIAFANTDHTYADDKTMAELTAPDPLAGLDDLATQVAAAGIRRVRGDVLIDDRLFDKAEGTGSGPRQITPIMINDNVIDLQIEPSEVGQPAKLIVRPQTAAVQVESKVITVASDQLVSTKVHYLGHNRISVTGQIPAGRKPLIRVHEVHNATAFARTLLIEALHRAGVVVDAPTLESGGDRTLPPAAEIAMLPRVAMHTSLPFSESAKLILKVSHNLHAGALPLLIAHKHGERTLSDGLKRQSEFLKRAGLDADAISFGSGAGGARGDLITARSAVELLRHMAKRANFQVYHDALPRLGVDGTLAKNLPHDSPARDKIQAKSGTYFSENTMNGTRLLNSKALAGYMTTAKGRPLAFALFVNNTHLRDGVTPSTFGDDLGKICEFVFICE